MLREAAGCEPPSQPGHASVNSVPDLVPVSARLSASRWISAKQSGAKAGGLQETGRMSRRAPADSGAAGSVTNRKAAARAFLVPPIAQRTSSWNPAASAENPLVVPAWERAGPRVCSPGLGFIRPARPSKRASVPVWGASGARRPLRKPHRRASGSSSARAHEAAQTPPARRSSGVPSGCPSHAR
jgi:hypothetical protein